MQNFLYDAIFEILNHPSSVVSATIEFFDNGIKTEILKDGKIFWLFVMKNNRNIQCVYCHEREIFSVIGRRYEEVVRSYLTSHEYISRAKQIQKNEENEFKQNLEIVLFDDMAKLYKHKKYIELSSMENAESTKK